jgi:uncharacterized coiled-coil protein SlyX
MALSDQELKTITVILRALMEKMNSMQEQMGNPNR